jgi:hypothetical protein
VVEEAHENPFLKQNVGFCFKVSSYRTVHKNSYLSAVRDRVAVSHITLHPISSTPCILSLSRSFLIHPSEPVAAFLAVDAVPSMGGPRRPSLPPSGGTVSRMTAVAQARPFRGASFGAVNLGERTISTGLDMRPTTTWKTVARVVDYRAREAGRLH